MKSVPGGFWPLIISVCGFIMASGCNDARSLRDLLSTDETEVAAETIRSITARGESAIGELKPLATDRDVVVRARAREALSRITGQWGSDGSLIWKRSVAEAINPTKPLMVLHLFGEFDKEYC